jgi:hypothetical protein
VRAGLRIIIEPRSSAAIPRMIELAVEDDRFQPMSGRGLNVARLPCDASDGRNRYRDRCGAR